VSAVRFDKGTETELVGSAVDSVGATVLQFLNTGFSKSGNLALFVGGGSVVTSLGALLAKSVYGPLR
jgi:hypothetical protein